MRVLLASCPVADPTGPYHSLAYLASFARARGVNDIDVRDLNVGELRQGSDLCRPHPPVAHHSGDQEQRLLRAHPPA